MDREDIKRILGITEVKYSHKEINDIFRIRTQRSLKKINQKMFWDALAMIAMVLVLVGTTFILGLQDRYLISAEIVGFALVLAIHYRIKYHLLNKFNYLNDVKTILSTVKRRLARYLKAYLYIIPTLVAILYGGIQWTLIKLTAPPAAEITIRLSLVFPIVIFAHWATKKLIGLVYGNDLKELNDLIEEMIN